MKKTLSALFVLVLLPGFYLLTQPEPNTASVKLKVTSLESGQEFRFNGKYFAVHGDSEVISIGTQTTPFEIEIELDEFVALFESENGESKLAYTMSLSNGSVRSFGDRGFLMRVGNRGVAVSD